VPVATGNAVFPSAVSPKYSGESAGKARRETCLDQYRPTRPPMQTAGLNGLKKEADITANATSA
jgi:hypothetical protein